MSDQQTFLEKFKTRGPRPIWLRYLLIIAFAVMVLHALLNSQQSGSALVYIAVPYLVGVAIYCLIPQPKGLGRIARFFRHMMVALIIMLSTSVILREGIICVAMFLPIYIFFSMLYFLMAPPLRNPNDPKAISDVFKVSFVPVLVAFMSLEGISETLSFEREEIVTRSMIVDGDIATLKSNMAMPIHLEEERSWFLRLFPLPYDVAAGNLIEGETHSAKFAYHRWIFTNTHYGETHLKLAEVGEQHVRTEITKDTSYFSKYMTIKGTLVEFEPITENTTRVILTVDYTRDLDPAWYFGPLQRRAMRESADYLITQVIARPESR